MYHERMQEAEQQLLASASRELGELGATATWEFGGDGTDGVAHVVLDGHDLTFPLEIKPQVRPSTIGPLLHPRMRGRLLVTHHVTGPVGAQLRQHDLNYIDSAGNASIRGPGVRLHVEGRRPPAAAQPPTLFSRAAMPVLLVLLDNPELIDAPLRRVRELSGVSLGTVQRVVHQLRNDGLAKSGPSSGNGWRRLLDGWCAAYLAGPRPQSLIGTYSSDLPSGEFLGRLGALPALVSGEAAARLAGFDIRPASVDLYVHDKTGELLRHGRLRPAPDGWIAVRRAMWPPAADRLRGDVSNLAPMPVRYADLVAVPDPRVQRLVEEVELNDPDLRTFRTP